MVRLRKLIDEYWAWTGLPKDLWGKIDIVYTAKDSVWFPGIKDVCVQCIQMVNQVLSPDEIEDFLFGMALNAEDEDILDYCKVFADKSFISTIVATGVTFGQSEARWQIAELLRKDILGRDNYLSVLQQDADEYVRRRTANVIEDIRNNT